MNIKVVYKDMLHTGFESWYAHLKKQKIEGRKYANFQASIKCVYSLNHKRMMLEYS